MIDRDRIQFKLDQIDGYLRELGAIVPERFEEYLYIEKKRACERLVQALLYVESSAQPPTPTRVQETGHGHPLPA